MFLKKAPDYSVNHYIMTHSVILFYSANYLFL